MIEAESAAIAQHNEPVVSATEDNLHDDIQPIVYDDERVKQLELMVRHCREIFCNIFSFSFVKFHRSNFPQYIQAKKDKEKATRILIQLIGKVLVRTRLRILRVTLSNLNFVFYSLIGQGG